MKTNLKRSNSIGLENQNNSLNVSENEINKTLSKRMLGKMLLTLRKNNENSLYAALGGVFDNKLIGNELILTFNSQTYYQEVMKQANLNTLKSILKEQFGDYDLKINLVEKEKKINYETLLRQEFKKMLKIKRKGENKYV